MVKCFDAVDLLLSARMAARPDRRSSSHPYFNHMTKESSIVLFIAILIIFLYHGGRDVMEARLLARLLIASEKLGAGDTKPILPTEVLCSV